MTTVTPRLIVRDTLLGFALGLVVVLSAGFLASSSAMHAPAAVSPH